MWAVELAMQHHIFLSLYVPKAKETVTEYTFRWSETNLFRLPKVDKQCSINFFQSARKNSTFYFPNTELRDNMNNLASIFQQGADRIGQDKLTSINFNTSLTRVDKAENHSLTKIKCHLLLQGQKNAHPYMCYHHQL